MNKHYSKQFKTEFVGKYLDGQSISDISVETGVSRSTLYSWIESEKNHFTSKANLNLRDYKSINDFKTSIAKYIEFYNNERPHSTIRYKSPSQYDIDYWIKVNKTK